jgi:hypothetical protein
VNLFSALPAAPGPDERLEGHAAAAHIHHSPPRPSRYASSCTSCDVRIGRLPSRLCRPSHHQLALTLPSNRRCERSATRCRPYAEASTRQARSRKCLATGSRARELS